MDAKQPQTGLDHGCRCFHQFDACGSGRSILIQDADVVIKLIESLRQRSDMPGNEERLVLFCGTANYFRESPAGK